MEEHDPPGSEAPRHIRPGRCFSESSCSRFRHTFWTRDAHLVQVLFPDSRLSFRSSRADSYQLPSRNLLICDEETPPNVTEDFWRSSNQINAKGLSLKERWIRSVTAPPRRAAAAAARLHRDRRAHRSGKWFSPSSLILSRKLLKCRLAHLTHNFSNAVICALLHLNIRFISMP